MLQFREHIKQNQKAVEQVKAMALSDQRGQEAVRVMRDSVKSNLDQNLPGLVKNLFSLYDLSQDLKIRDPSLDIEEHAKIEM